MTCPACGKAGSVRARSAGRTVRCTGCGTNVRVSRPGEEPEPPAAPEPSEAVAGDAATELPPPPERGPKSVPNSRVMTAVAVACGAAGGAFLLTPFGTCMAAPVA